MQTVCPFCRSIIVRHDVDLTRVGVVSDLPDDSSPLQIGATGTVDQHSFTVTGRIIYEYDGGGWNEWHLASGPSSFGWLSDAMAEYAVTSPVRRPPTLPDAQELTRGRRLVIDAVSYEVATVTLARYRGVEGDLPFEYWDKQAVRFVDLRSETGRLATIDYSETPPLVFAGRFYEFRELHLSGLRRFEGWPT